MTSLPLIAINRMPPLMPSSFKPVVCSARCKSSSDWGPNSVVDTPGPTPMVNNPPPGCSFGVSVKTSGCAYPGRATSNFNSSPGLAMAEAMAMSANVCAGVPSMDSTRSPANNPSSSMPSCSALSGAVVPAGRSNATDPITGASNRTPTMNAAMKSTTARSRFITTPAETTIMRLPIGQLL